MPLRSFVLALVLVATSSAAASLDLSVVPSTLKVRPTEHPAGAALATLKAGRNEFEAFQIVLFANGGPYAAVSARVETPLTGPASFPSANVVLYAERYYRVGVASNDEGAPGLWPDPLVPDVDTYFAQKRNAFPFAIPAQESRVVWVDVLVPQGQEPGDYAGSIAIDVGGVKQASVPISLHVGSFSLPSTATLTSAFGMGWNTPPLVHCGGAFPYCNNDEDASNAIRALYLRAALEHRVTISSTDFQPPFGGSQAPFEAHVLPLIDGTATTRLPGARLTTVMLDGNNSQVGAWIAYAKAHGFFDRLFYYPVDEPGSNAATWSQFSTAADALHAADANAQICLTSTITEAIAQGGVQNKIDIFVPVLDQMYGRPGSGFVGDQRANYDAWQMARTGRKVWMYQSCDQHGCGSCGTPSPGVDYTGWPQRVIDSTGVQDRAFPWLAWQERVTGELYFETTYQLATAWNDDGQCAFSGSGDGTIFYPGKPSIIGGTADIPIESIRLKLIREGMEDYEYLAQVALANPTLAHSVADALFPSAYDCAKSPAQLEAARSQLFAALDVVVSPDAGVADAGTDGGVDAGSEADAGTNADAGHEADAGPSSDAGMTPGAVGSCGCSSGPLGFSLVFLSVAAFLKRRR